MENLISFLDPLLNNLARYLVIAGIPFMVFYIFFPQSFSLNKIQQRFAKNRDFIRELFHSVKTTFVLAGIIMVIINTPLKEDIQIYDSVTAYPIWWIPLSILVAVGIQDTYLYWTHRIMHHPQLFKHTHMIHHQSVNPSPLTAYSFNLIEGFIEAIIAPIILLFIPMHSFSVICFICFSLSINVYAHLGYEIAPRWFRRTILFEIFTTSVHHNIHHEKFHGNYGFYFRFWDRLMQTEHPDYVKLYDQIQEKRFGKVELVLEDSQKTVNQ